MNLRLRLLLGVLSDARAYRRRFRLPWVLVIIALTTIVGLGVVAAYTLWFFWPTLLLVNMSAFFSFSSFSFWGALAPAIPLIRLPLDFARLASLYSTEPASLALAVKRALASGDDTIAPVVAAPTEDAEPSLFASAPKPSAVSLVVAIPDALMIALANPIGFTVISALLLLMATGGAAFATVIFNMSFGQLLGSQSGQLYLVGVCGSLTFLGLLTLWFAQRQLRLRRMQQRGMEVTLDDLGLSFHQPVWAKRRRQITWAEMRGLGRYTYKDKQTREVNLYILTSDEQTLIWEEPPTERYALPADRQRITALQQAAWDLSSNITRHTRLPIRDVSEALAVMANTASSTSSASTGFHFLKEAYDAALAEKDVETATALWRLRRPRARRQPRALRKLAAAASTPALASLPPLDTPVAPTTPAPASRWSTQIAATRAASQKKREALLRVGRALIPWYPTEDAPTTPARFRRFLRRERMRRSLAWGLVWAMILIIPASAAASGLYQHQEQDTTSLLSAVPQQVVLQKPRYIATFISPQSDWPVQNDWPVQTPTKDYPTGAAFVDNAYQVSCTDPTVSAVFWIPQNEEGDIALSVAETIHGPFSKDNYAAGGLVFDVTDNGYIFSTFGVDEHGDWYLERYNTFPDPNNPWSEIDTGVNSAIHTGDNATNTLLLVRHGTLYLLYVNNVLVDRYYDTDHALPAGGDVGVYIDACTIVARFYDFLSYPVPPRLAAIRVAPNLPWWLQ